MAASAKLSHYPIPIQLPNGHILEGNVPVVVVGPNGSGKTTQTRRLNSPAGHQIEFVNALRNTRVAAELPAMGQDSARAQFDQQKIQARNQYWELTSEFDYMLSQLLAENAEQAMEFARRWRTNPASAGEPQDTALTRVENLWSQVFPGRELHWKDWKPLVTSSTSGMTEQYSGNHMSDGEKAALFVSSRVFSAPAGIMVVDEPETHFHTSLAVRLWNALEDARPDMRFVYVTHDFTFATSRRDARYVLASPTGGLRVIDLGETVPDDIAGALLGSASLSFYASRIVFCEGTETSYDARIYRAWFYGLDTVVKPVGGCDRVLRCVDALRQGGLSNSLQALGLIDRDFHSSAYIDSVPDGIFVIPVHEVESLFLMPAVVEAVAIHMAKPFDLGSYSEKIAGAISEQQQHALIIQRWKSSIEPHLTSLVSSTSKKNTTIAELIEQLPQLFSASAWTFSPTDLLTTERAAVEAAIHSKNVEEILKLHPGKHLLPIAAQYVGVDIPTYVNLIISSLALPLSEDSQLRDAVIAKFNSFMPPRVVPPAGTSPGL